MSFAFTFETHTKSFILQRLQCLLPLYSKDYQRLFTCRDFNVFFLLHFNDYQCLLSCKDFNVFSLQISKTIKVFYLIKTSTSSAFTFQRFSEYFVLLRFQCLLPLHFKDYESLLSCRDFNVYFLYILKIISLLSCRDFNLFFLYISKIIKVFLSCTNFNVFCVYISKTIKVICLTETSMSSAFIFQRLSKSFVVQGVICLLHLHFQPN